MRLVMGLALAYGAACVAAGDRLHIDVGLGALSAESTRFHDVKSSDETDLAVLYGSASRYTEGEFDLGSGLRLGIGYDWTPRLQTLLEAGFDGELGFDGNANYSGAGDRQPSEGELSTRRLLLAGRYQVWWRQVAGWARPLGLYVTAGAGVTEYRLTSFVQRFPALRRGPGGEVPLTRLPAGRDRERTFMIGFGVTVPWGTRNTLDFGYRFLNGGEVRTDVGNIDVVRYRADGSRRDLAIPIDRTAADFDAHVPHRDVAAALSEKSHTLTMSGRTWNRAPGAQVGPRAGRGGGRIGRNKLLPRECATCRTTPRRWWA